MAKHIIHLNGKSYDAISGQLIDANHSSVEKNTQDKPVNSAEPSKQETPHKKPTAQSDTTVRTHKTAESSAKHQAMRSQTLMRHTVKRPKLTEDSSGYKISVHKITTEPKQASHASGTRVAITRNPLVSRFNDISSSNHTQKKSTITVGAGSNQKAAKSTDSSVSLAPPPISVHSTKSAKKPTTMDSFLNAIEHAEAHQQPKLKRSKRRGSRSVFANAAYFTAAFALIAGFFAYQNIPNVSLRIASSNSGLEGRRPGYTPSGFSMNNKIDYSPGQITLFFKSNSDDRSFKLTQTASAWDSESLQQSFLATDNNQYQAVDSNGKKLYFYGKNNVTWVDKGIWYNLESDTDLSRSQLHSLADSI